MPKLKKEAPASSDLPGLLAELRAMQSPKAAVRVAELAKAKDSRLVDALLDVLENPPYTSGSSKKFWQAVVAALQGTKDEKAREAMLDLSTRYKSINNTVMGAWIGTALGTAARKMAAPASAAKAKPQSLDQVFAQIVAAPDDDGPRLVYADILSQKGKPRGELIMLQLERAAGRGTPERADREREEFVNEDNALAKFATPLLTACDAVTFERGFPVAAHLAKKGLEQVTDAIEWGTIRKLTGIHSAAVTAVVKLVASGKLANLVHVGKLTKDVLAKLKGDTFPWQSIEIDPDNMPADVLGRFPALRELLLHGDAPAGFFDHAPNLEVLEFDDTAPADLRSLLAGNRKLRSIRVSQVAEPIAGLPIEHIAMKGTCDTAVSWLRELPNVRHLELSDDTLFRNEEGEVFSWNGLRELLAMKQLERIRLSRFRGSFACEFVRGANGWTFVLPCANRWVGFYEQLAAIASQVLALGITGVTLYPEEPRHYQEPFSDAKPEHIEAITTAYKPLDVAMPDAYVWPAGEAPEEGWALDRGRACPSR